MTLFTGLGRADKTQDVRSMKNIFRNPRFLDAKPPVNDATNQNLSTLRRQSGILVNLHAALSMVIGSHIPDRFGHQEQMNNLLRDHI